MRTEYLDDGYEVNCLDDYTVVIKAIQVPIFEDEIEDKSDMVELWKFIVEFRDINEDKNVEIPSYRTYQTYEDAIQDAYGVIELFGFMFKDESDPTAIEILRWSYEDQELETDYILFDGLDFYPLPDDYDFPDDDDKD